MRKVMYAIVVVGALMFTACGNSSSTVETSPEMQEFIGMLHGTSDDVAAALEKFGANDDIVNDDMGMYNLESPVVTAKNGDCYTVDFKAGMTTREYEICWTDGKISQITDKGMKLE